MRTRLWMVALLAVVLSPALAAAQKDADGAKDHPAIPRMPGYYIESYAAQDFAAHEFEVKDGEKKVEGRYWQIDYWIMKGQKAAGPLQIGRNYRNAFSAKGGQLMLEDMSASGGHTVLRMPTGGGKFLWMDVHVSDRGESYQLTIVEEAGLDKVIEVTASELTKALKEQGTASIYGILFDTGKATIKPESETTLATIADVLTKERAMKIEIQGHTDNVGNKAGNQRLSAARAAAVKTYLVQTHSIAADRLTTAGFADDKPVADNTSDAGRAKNRRVELVRK